MLLFLKSITLGTFPMPLDLSVQQSDLDFRHTGPYIGRDPLTKDLLLGIHLGVLLFLPSKMSMRSAMVLDDCSCRSVDILEYAGSLSKLLSFKILLNPFALSLIDESTVYMINQFHLLFLSFFEI